MNDTISKILCWYIHNAKYADISGKRGNINGIIKERQTYQVIPVGFDSELQMSQNIILILKPYTVSRQMPECDLKLKLEVLKESLNKPQTDFGPSQLELL
jgi:hypothetical protein